MKVLSKDLEEFPEIRSPMHGAFVGLHYTEMETEGGIRATVKIRIPNYLRDL